MKTLKSAIDPVGCVKPVFDNAAFANADLRSRFRRVQVRHAGDHGDRAIGLLEGGLIDVGCAVELEGDDRDIWIGAFGQVQCQDIAVAVAGLRDVDVRVFVGEQGRVCNAVSQAQKGEIFTGPCGKEQVEAVCLFA